MVFDYQDTFSLNGKWIKFCGYSSDNFVVKLCSAKVTRIRGHICAILFYIYTQLIVKSRINDLLKYYVNCK